MEPQSFHSYSNTPLMLSCFTVKILNLCFHNVHLYQSQTHYPIIHKKPLIRYTHHIYTLSFKNTQQITTIVVVYLLYESENGPNHHERCQQRSQTTRKDYYFLNGISHYLLNQKYPNYLSRNIHLYYFPRVSVTKFDKLGILKQEIFILLQF